MDRARLFPDAHAEGLQARVEAYWNFDFILPTPRAEIACSCGGVHVLKDWLLHERQNKRDRFRCDVRTKCVACSVVWLYGVRVEEDHYRRAKARFHRGGWISWRDGRTALDQEGFFD